MWRDESLTVRCHIGKIRGKMNPIDELAIPGKADDLMVESFIIII
jgi:hypothetical protein